MTRLVYKTVDYGDVLAEGWDLMGCRYGGDHTNTQTELDGTFWYWLGGRVRCAKYGKANTPKGKRIARKLQWIEDHKK